MPNIKILTLAVLQIFCSKGHLWGLNSSNLEVLPMFLCFNVISALEGTRSDLFFTILQRVLYRVEAVKSFLVHHP